MKVKELIQKLNELSEEDKEKDILIHNGIYLYKIKEVKKNFEEDLIYLLFKRHLFSAHK